MRRPGLLESWRDEVSGCRGVLRLQPFPMTDDLRRRAVRAIGASSVGGWLAKLISLLSTLVLVRLLTPEDFGLMAIATTAAGFIGFFNEVGMGAAIVQRKELRDAEINGCFGIAVLASAVL